MNAKRILVPLDLMHSTVDPLVFVQCIASEAPICATLLHVVGVNLAPSETRVYKELCSEAEAALNKLAKLFFGDTHETRVSVRVGRPHQQILAEARASRSELIILTGGKPGSWACLFGMGTAARVTRGAPCPTLVLPRGRPACQFAPATIPEDVSEVLQWPETPRQRVEAAETFFARGSNRAQSVR